MNQWYIISLIGGLLFALLGLLGILYTIKNKDSKARPISIFYIVSGLIVSIISYVMY